MSLPTGTVIFLFTDIEGSTRLLGHLGYRYTDALTQYQHLLCNAVQDRGGQPVDACVVLPPAYTMNESA